MELNERLYELRKSNGWSQEELAEKMEVSRQTVSKWESGKAIPELNKLIKLSEIYKITLDELVKETTVNKIEEKKTKTKKNHKKLLIIVLIIILILIVLFGLNVMRRLNILYDISVKYKSDFQSIGETRSGHIQEHITKRDINNIEETDKEYLYYVSDNERLLKIISYEITDDEELDIPRKPIEEIYIDLNKEINDTLYHYSDVTKVNLQDGTREVIADYEFKSPIMKATECMNNYYSTIFAYDNLFNGKEVALDFGNKLFETDENYGWNNSSIKGLNKNIGMSFNDKEFFIHFDNCEDDIKEKREIVSTVISNEIKPTREEVLPLQN